MTAPRPDEQLDVLFSHARVHQPELDEAPLRPLMPLVPRELAAWLNERTRFRARAWEPTFRPIEDFEIELSRRRPHIVWLHAERATRARTLELLTRARRQGCAVVVGGPDAQQAEGRYLSARADAVVVGEGEPLLEPLVEALIPGRSDRDERLTAIRGLTLAGPRGPVHTGGVSWLRDVSELPSPLREPASLQTYLETWYAWTGMAAISLRSCRPAIPGIAPLRRRPAAAVADEIRAALTLAEKVAGLGLRADDPGQTQIGVFMADEEFSRDPDWLAELAEEWRFQRRTAPIHCLAEVPGLSDVHARALAGSGVRRAWLRAWSGSDRVLSLAGARHRVPEIYRAAAALSSAGIEVGLILAVGHPSEGPADHHETMRMVEALAPQVVDLRVRWHRGLKEGGALTVAHRAARQGLLDTWVRHRRGGLLGGLRKLPALLRSPVQQLLLRRLRPER